MEKTGTPFCPKTHHELHTHEFQNIADAHFTMDFNYFTSFSPVMVYQTSVERATSLLKHIRMNSITLCT